MLEILFERLKSLWSLYAHVTSMERCGLDLFYIEKILKKQKGRLFFFKLWLNPSWLKLMHHAHQPKEKQIDNIPYEKNVFSGPGVLQKCLACQVLPGQIKLVNIHTRGHSGCWFTVCVVCVHSGVINRWLSLCWVLVCTNKKHFNGHHPSLSPLRPSFPHLYRHASAFSGLRCSREEIHFTAFIHHSSGQPLHLAHFHWLENELRRPPLHPSSPASISHCINFWLKFRTKRSWSTSTPWRTVGKV